MPHWSGRGNLLGQTNLSHAILRAMGVQPAHLVGTIESLISRGIEVVVRDHHDVTSPRNPREQEIAVVDSTHRAATMVGYSLAPVVVARNPAFKLGGGDAHIKFTVCVFEPKFADIKSALSELAVLEAGWGGSPTIGGSPQGVSSMLTTEQVVEVVARHLK